MTEQHVVKLLWADDDSRELLSPLGYTLEESFILTKATNFVDALDLLNRDKPDSLLADIILPHSGGGGALGFDLGITLADRAAEMGVKAVSFLTVVTKSEVADKLDELERSHPRVRFTYFDKLMLLEFNTIEVLMKSLTLPK